MRSGSAVRLFKFRSLKEEEEGNILDSQLGSLGALIPRVGERTKNTVNLMRTENQIQARSGF